MNFGRPWNIEGVRLRARETARAAARRSGVTVGEWLDSAIIEQAAEEGIGSPWVQDEKDRPREDLAAISDRLADVTKQLDQIERSDGGRQPDERASEGSSRQLVDAIARLDQRLDQVIAEGRSAASEIEKRAMSIDHALINLGRARLHAAYLAPGSPPPTEPKATHDRAQKQASDAHSARAAFEPPQGTFDLARLEQQLQQLGRQIDIFARPGNANAAVEALRADLGDIKRILTGEMPSRTVEAIKSEIRSLVERLDASRGIDPADFASLERGLAELRDELRRHAPVERRIGFDQVVQTLSRKIDIIAAGRQDPSSLQRIDEAIAALRNMVSQLASSDALASVANDVRLLAEKIERAGPAGDNTAVNLDARIAAIANALESHRREHERTAPRVDTAVQSLTDKLERAQGSSESPPASAQLENRISQLVQRVDASEARLAHLGSIERGLAELVAHLEQMRSRNARGVGAAQFAVSGTSGKTAEALRHQVDALKQAQAVVESRTEDSLEAVQDAVGDVVSRLSTVESDMREVAPPFAATRGRPEQTSVSAPPTAAKQDGQPSASNARHSIIRDYAHNNSVNSVRARTADQVARSTQAGLLPVGPDPAIADRARAQTNTEQKPAAPSAPSPSPAQPHPFAVRMTRFGRAPANEVRSPRPMPLAATRQPIDPTLPPETPLEPGLGKQRLGTTKGSRFAASTEEARADEPGEATPRAEFIAAARRAAQVAAGEQEDARTDREAAPATTGKTLAQRMKTLFFGGFLLVGIVVAPSRLGLPPLEGGQHGTGINRGGSAPSITTAPSPLNSASAREDAIAITSGRRVESSTPPILLSRTSSREYWLAGAATQVPSDHDPDASDPNSNASLASRGDPIAGPTQGAAIGTPPPSLAPDIAQTASSSPPTAVSSAPEGDRRTTINSASQLYAALSAGNAAAAYEMGSRFAEGRGVTLNFQQAAIWFDRAAKAGSVPGLFRLASLYENGQGVGKDLQEARRLYRAAADKGHAKAMHNLAVLYVQAIDGKPDYTTAARWFQKAANHAVVDSQYNLGILFSRGIGVDQNLAEAYKWFALAAVRGDRDAANKRDDVAAHLDEQSLLAARHAVQAFVAQPADVMTNPEPPGGWDQVPTGASPKGTPVPRVTAPQPRVIL